MVKNLALSYDNRLFTYWKDAYLTKTIINLWEYVNSVVKKSNAYFMCDNYQLPLINIIS